MLLFCSYDQQGVLCSTETAISSPMRGSCYLKARCDNGRGRFGGAPRECRDSSARAEIYDENRLKKSVVRVREWSRKLTEKSGQRHAED
jgi:hypothetical protein